MTKSNAETIPEYKQERIEYIRETWRDYRNIGPARAEKLRENWDTPKQFVRECVRENPDYPTYVAIDLTKIRVIETIGQETACSVTNQMVEDMEIDENRHLRDLPESGNTGTK